MNVHDLMTMPVATCTPETNLATAAMEMWRNDCGAVPVVDADGKVVGMITAVLGDLPWSFRGLDRAIGSTMDSPVEISSWKRNGSCGSGSNRIECRMSLHDMAVPTPREAHPDFRIKERRVMETLCVIHDDPIVGGCPGEAANHSFDPWIVRFPALEAIVEEGSFVDGVFCLHCGSVALTRRDAAGQNHCTYILRAGDLIGIPAILTGTVHTNGAVALEPVSACFIPRERFREMVRCNPMIIIHALRQIALRIDEAEHDGGDVF